ncbi:MAG: response regulator [Deltaproteobacteria bacterium]|nr:response regulator [Deltaproteobacteria bacterium]
MSQPRVVIIDDEERFRTTLRKTLTLQGVQAADFGSGREALQALREQGADVVLLDLRMPEMDGLATLQAIKAIDPEIEVIILTGHASLDAAQEIIKLGAYDYLLKPCPTDELLAKVESACERQAVRRGPPRRDGQ